LAQKFPISPSGWIADGTEILTITTWCCVGEMGLRGIDEVAVAGFLGFPALLARVILASLRHDVVGKPNDVATPCKKSV
jgi:hypothetical protein